MVWLMGATFGSFIAIAYCIGKGHGFTEAYYTAMFKLSRVEADYQLKLQKLLRENQELRDQLESNTARNY